MQTSFEKFKVNAKFLFRTLTPTSKNTNWYDPPPEGKITQRQIGRLILQFHQVANFINQFHNKKNPLKFLDVGTGNGILPELISNYCKSKISHGIDPYEDGEHKTSWPTGTRPKLLTKIKKIFKGKKLNIRDYKSLLNYEALSHSPSEIKLHKNPVKWKFFKKFVHELPKKKKYNFIFAKCIDHISDWNSLLQNISNRTEKDSIMFIKHNSFFSYNGAHRYASTFIPWGHVVLNEKKFEKYSKKFHSSRSEKMIDFFYNGLSYPRNTLSELIDIMHKFNWKIVHLEQSNKKDYQSLLKLAGGSKKLIDDARRNYPSITLSEMISDRMLIVGKKIK
jgi:2-polyprenyl-3-methyl-5-hydroxy-6-metoxy-1,4-benzoquinol methylase